MFVKLQRTQGIIIILDDRTKICSKKSHQVGMMNHNRQDEQYQEKEI